MTRARHRSARRFGGFVAVLITLVAAALATTGQADAHASTGPTASGPTAPGPTTTAPRTSAPRTTVRLDISGCSRCHVQLQHAVNGVQQVWTSHPQRIGSDHVAVFHMQTARTHGLSFTIWAPWEGDIDAVLNMATRYRGFGAGSSVTADDARSARHAEGCWAGTSARHATLHFQVVRLDSTTVTGDATQIPLTFATDTLPSWRPMVRAHHGIIGNQDAFYCTQPVS